MANLQVSAKMKIREGMLEGIKQHANECIQRVKEKDPGTIQYDWFISSDNTDCEIREHMKILKHSWHIYPTFTICYRYSMKNLLQITLLQFMVIPHKIF
jgi:hypothetical protein